MKRNLTAIAAVLLTVVMLAGCAEPELARGTIKDNVYTNESAELMFTLPDGWKYATDEEIAEILGINAEMMGHSEEEVSDEAFKEVNTIDMFAFDTATNTSVEIMFQNLAAVPGAIHLDEKTFLDLYKEEINKSETHKYSFTLYNDAEICSNTFKVMSVTDTDNGVPQYLYIRRVDDYMLHIFTVIPKGSDLDSVMANFS